MRQAIAICLGLLLSAVWADQAPARKPPLVLVSIKPLYGLVASIMEGVGAPTLIFNGNPIRRTDPLTDDERALLLRARLVFWIGPELERPLQPVLAHLKDRVRAVALLQAPGVRLMDRVAERPLTPPRTARQQRKVVVKTAPGGRRTVIIQRGGGAPAAVRRKPRPAARATPKRRPLTKRDLTPRYPDPHAWLDPRNAIAMARHAAQILADADPDNASLYRRNLVRLIVRIETLDAELRARLQSIPAGRYVTLSNNIQYFERHYLLSSAARIGLDPRRLDDKVIAQARQRLSHESSRCIFASTGFDAGTQRALGSQGAAIVTLDIYGLAKPAAADHYFLIMRRMTQRFAACVDPAQRSR